MAESPTDSQAAQRRLLRALDQAAARIEELERGQGGPVAVIGLGCRLPGAVRDAASYWRLLREGVDAVAEVPADRWDAAAYFDPRPESPGKICTRQGGFLEEVDRFDADFFGISPREAEAMDPQQRLLLEVAHEALDGAGQLGDRQAENRTGVFVGLTNGDYGQLLKTASVGRPLDQYFVTGNSPNAAAGRISYHLGLRGPSLAVDAACSASLAAVHLACQSLRAGDCRLALAGGVNLILAPDASIALSRARMLAPDGRCKTFSAAADGYGRGEGCGLVVLKRLDDARRDGDRVLAVIRGSAINQDGPTGGFTVPSGAAQRRLLEAALAQAGLAPADIDYVEAHGTGTSLGDPIEVNALADVLGPGRPASRPLLVGSVKTNLGHLESAAGVAGLMKAALALWHGEIPPHLHFERPNPRIAWEDVPVRVASSRVPWPETGRPRRAGVSAFGVSGTNVHLILEQAPADLAAPALPEPRRRFRGPRHWFAPPSAAQGVPLYEIAWRSRPLAGAALPPPRLAEPAAHAAGLRGWASRAPGGGGAYGGALAGLEALARIYARQACDALDEASVPAERRRLFARVQKLAAEAEAGGAGARTAQLRAACPEAAIELELLGRCGARLSEVLQGGCDPLTLLFPAGEAVTAASLYRDAPVARRMHALLGAALAGLFPAGGRGRPPRVLEIGAGTGATTEAALGALPAEAEYAFTDVSPFFVAEGARRFDARPGFRCRTLDIERDPRTQGFGAGEFDLVIAANVLHATRDLGEALRHARSLLAPGGALLLLEATRPLGFLDLIFGLTEGWWRFADPELRPDHPLLPARRWPEALRAAGFGSPEVLGFPESDGAVFAAQSVVVARREGPAEEWLIVADRPGVAPALAAALERGGGASRLVRGDEAAAAIAAGHRWRGVADLRGLDAGDPRDEMPARSALLLSQALIARPAPIWIATRGAVAAGPGDPVPGVGAAPLWGLARSLGQEHPELRPVLVDLDPAAAPAEAAEALAAELLAADGETQVAWRGGERRAARLVAVAAGAFRSAALRGDGTYLVVGGLGGLGRPLARWLAEHGARHLVLAGRSDPDDSALELVRELAARGTEVRLERADFAVEAEAARVLARIADSPWPLRGAIHAAGVLADGVVGQLDWERFARVLAPKVGGAWNLHRLTAGASLDFFVLFSSATAILGSPGQSNHAAANAFLDSLAHHRRAAGLPALSVGWGAWARIGAAAARGVAGRFRARGIGEIAPAEGWRALERLLGGPSVQVAALPADWAAVPEALVRSPFFDEVRAAAPTAEAEAEAEERLLTDALPAGQRRTRLVAEVRRQVARILNLPAAESVDPARGFFTLGMDSLTSVELRNRLQARLGRTLPATAVFDHPTAAALGAFLAGGEEPGREPIPPPLSAAPAEVPAARLGAEPIAIVGVGLRFPGGADSPESLWQLLVGGVDAVGAVPADRWDADALYDPDPGAPGKICTRQGGFLAAVDQFDAAFFGISPREAAALDPQQRLLLEVSWEALERAGIAPDSLGGSRTGVFVGISGRDYAERLLAAGPEGIDSYVGSGNASSVAAGRLSYTLGLQGPCLAVDTACSSSLVAVHLACQSLRTGECGLALAAGVNLLLSPTISINHSRARMLSADGRCKAFAASADGFGRAEGCGVVVLRRLDEARRAGDRVLAVIRGSAVSQDGRTSGLTVPSGPSQQAVIRAALAQAGVAPADVALIEAHGTGTALGDPIEAGALAAVFGPGRPAGRALHVGSIKSNLGHCEAAAGVAGLIKAALAVSRREIPPHLHFAEPSPHIPWEEAPWLRVPTEAVAWPEGARALAGVSSFGFGGTNAHVLVEAPPVDEPAPAAPGHGGVLILSAKGEPALRELAARYGRWLEDADGAGWADACRTAATGRARLPQRLALAAESGAREKLAAFVRGELPPGVWTGAAGEWPRVAFLFSGQGSLYAGAGQELYAGCEAYRVAFDACAEIVRRLAGWSLLEVIDSAERLARTEYGQVALFAVEFSLNALWQSWGLLPDAVVGHSVGEFAAACAAGRLALEQALPLLIVRARLMGALGETGAMAAVAGGEADVAGVIARHGVELAAVNSPRQVVLTGERMAVAAAVAELKAAGRRAQLLEARQGYHSRQMEPMLAEFTRLADEILGDYRPPGKIPDPAVAFLSGVSGVPAEAELGRAEYWVRQIRQPVRFADAMTALRAERIELVVEVGPRGILAALGQQVWPAGSAEWLTSLAPDRDDRAQMEENAARAWVKGSPIDWTEVHRGARRPRAALPTYPFQRRRHWCAETARAAAPLTAEFAWETIALGPPAASGPLRSWYLEGGSAELRRELGRELGRQGRAAVERAEGPLEGIVFLAEERGAIGPPATASAACVRLAALARTAAAGQGRLWIVTRGAAAGLPGEGAELGLGTAPLWGFGKAFALEHPGRFGGLLDLPPAPLAGEAERAVTAWLASGGEDQLALRGEGFRAPRLRPVPAVAGAFPLRPEGTYLVTGGLGALGLRTAAWLVSRGARHLVLAGRNPPSAAAAAEIARLRAAGAAIETAALDVADAPSVARLVAGMPALRGVVHAAGLPGFSPVAQLEASALEAVLRPKIGGAWALHQATLGRPLDFFVLYSSIAAAWGSKGQAHYAAANQFLDALAHHRRARGLAALSIAWGPWSGGGMATPEATALLARAGIGTLAPAEALAALEAALAAQSAQRVVARVDWNQLLPALESRGPRPMLAAFAGSLSPPAPPAKAEAELAALPFAERVLRLRPRIQAVVAGVLRLPEGELPPPRTGFAELGVDSLLAVEIRNRLGASLGLALPATLAFDHPDMERLAQHLAGRLGPPPEEAPAAGADEAAEMRSRIAAMTEEEAEAALLRKLEEL